MRNVLIRVSGIAVIIGLVVGCGGSTLSAPSSDAGTGTGKATQPDASLPDARAGSPACTALAACCQSGSISDPSACAATALSGALTNSGCAMELAVYQANGFCASTVGTPDATVSPPADVFVPPPQDVFVPPPQDVFVPPFNEGGAETSTPPSTTCNPACTGSQVCGQLPGTSASCVDPCHSDTDCPALMTCGAGGVCTYQCTSCPAGQQCGGLAGFGPGACSSNSDCAIGTYCTANFGPGERGMCFPYEGCTECEGDCPKCIGNSQCDAGQVCVNEACVACSDNSQCGSSATAACTATHTGFQCTCTASTDCSTGQTCQGGLCATSFAATGCQADFGSACPTGQACVNNVCGACTTFADCNPPTDGEGSAPGLACIAGTCTSCTANRQCGGGMACVGGTCGTCATGAQCGATGQCTDGFCTCTDDGQCGTGQRCGSGVCVTM